jgi:hypothetical protein
MELNENKIIKSIIPATCPNCGKQIFVGYQTMMPGAVSITNEDDLKTAKKDVINRLNDIVFKDEAKKKNWIDWLSKEETLIEPSDVDSIIKEILNETNDNSSENKT